MYNLEIEIEKENKQIYSTQNKLTFDKTANFQYSQLKKTVLLCITVLLRSRLFDYYPT